MSEIVDCIGWIVRKTCWSLGVFFEFLVKRLLDLFGLIFNIIACCTILRLPAMLHEFSNMDSWWTWRFVGFVQFLIFIMDVPILIMLLFILCTFIRIYPLHKELKDESQYQKISDSYSSKSFIFSGFKVRGIIIKNFIIVFVYLFCLIFVFFLLISWRNIIFCRRFREAGRLIENQTEKENERRKIIFVEFLQLFVDIPFILCLVLTFFTWRAPMVIIDIKHDRQENCDWNEIRWVGMLHFFLFLLDIPCIAVGLVALCSWRAPMVIYSVLGYNLFDRSSTWKSHRKVRKELVLQFIYLFIDIPVIICFLFVLVTIWRMPSLVRELQKISKKEYDRKHFYRIEFKIRVSCFEQFAMIWIDLFTFILAAIVFCTLWRTNPLIKDIKKSYGKYKNPPKEEEKDEEKKEKEEEQLTDIIDENPPLSVNEVTEDGTDNSNGTVVVIKDGAESAAETDNETKELNGTTPKMKWSKFMWKVRRKIVLHFLMLLLDITAFPLAILVLITGLRTSKLMSGLLGGNFYMMFAVTVYMETFRLFRDIAFIFLFLISMALRPINSWVYLLEDEEHREYRIVKELRVWIPDICLERKAVYDVMDDILALYIKQQKSEITIRSDLKKIMDKHTKRVDDLLYKFAMFDIEETEMKSLLEIVKFVESKRVEKMLRKYRIESNYINRCDRDLHDVNLRKYKDEMMKYEEEVNNAYDKLLNYKPSKVPLYADKSGLKLRSRKETQAVLIACLPRGRFLIGIMAFICTLFIYRAPGMYKALYRKPYDAFNIATRTLKEYGKDLVTILQILLILLFIYRAPAMLADIIDSIVVKRSWRGVRKVVRKYPPNIDKDFIDLIKKLLSWEVIRYTFVMIIFVILMPAELFLVVVRTCIKDKCLSFVCTGFLYFIFIVGPLVFATYGTDKLMSLDMGWVIEVALCAFLIALLLLLLIMVLSLAKDKKNKFLMTVRECDYVRLNWYNMHVILFELLEFLQTLALVFKFVSIPMYGGKVLSQISSYVLFSIFSYDVIFWITVVTFICWIFLCGAPLIFENILKKYDHGTIGKRPSWRLGLSLLANTLFVTIIENFLSSLACTYQTCPIENPQTTMSGMFLAGTNMTNSTADVCLPSRLIEDPRVQCWTIEHQGKATFALIAIVWYTTTSLIFGTKYGDPETKELDIVFCPIYNMIINVFKAAMIVVATILTDREFVVLGFLLAVFILCIFYTVSFRYIFKTDACNLRSVLVWRFCTFISSIFACIGVIVAFVLKDSESIVPLLIFLVGTFVTFCVSIIAAVKLSQTSVIERDRETFKELLIKLEERAMNEGWMHKHWIKERKTWLRLVRSVREAWRDDRYLTNKLNNEPESNGSNPVVVDQFVTADVDTAEGMLTMESNTETNNDISDTSPVTIENKSSTLQLETNDGIQLKSIQKGKESNIEFTSLKPQEDGGRESNIEEQPSQGNGVPPDLPAPPSSSSSDAVVNLPAPLSYGSTVRSVLPPETRNITPTYFVADSTIELEKNGRNLLLIFEKYVYYNAYRYASLFQRGFWINSVCASNWTGLLKQLQMLNTNLNGMYDKPSNIDMQLANLTSVKKFELSVDDQDLKNPPPPFVRKTIEEITADSSKLRNEILDFVRKNEKFGEQLYKLFDKVLPTIPVIKSFSINFKAFTITLRRSSKGTITSSEPPGHKMAVGASVCLGKVVRGYIDNDSLIDIEGLSAKKGPVSVNVKFLRFMYKNNNLYLSDRTGKKVKYDVALASCKTIKWS